MGFLIRLQVVYGSTTRSISGWLSKPGVRRIVDSILIFVLTFLAVDFFRYGLSGGSPYLFAVTLAALIGRITRGRLRFRPVREQVVEQKTAVDASGSKAETNIGPGRHHGHCSKCGRDISLNYGTAYEPLCRRCA
jgi:hypothetical protein